MDPIEELRKVVVQGFASVNDKIDSSIAALETRLGGRIDGLDGRLGTLEGKVSAVGGRLGAVEGRLGAVEGRLDTLEAKMDAGFARVDETLEYVKRGLLDHTKELQQIRSTLDKKVDRDEVEAIVERAVARAIGS